MSIFSIGSGPLQSLRLACVKAMGEEENQKHDLLLERSEGKAYAAAFVGEDNLILARIPDRYAKYLEVHLTEYERKE